MKKYKHFAIMVYLLFILNIQVSAQNVILRYAFDEDEGQHLLLNNIQASTFLKDDSGFDYSVKQAFDGQADTAWCVKGNGIGEYVKVNIEENQLHYKGMMNVYRLLIVNGLAKDKKIYFANNRIKKIELQFSEGERKSITLKDGVLDYQKFIINIKAKWVILKILDIYKGNKFNDTCISEIEFETWTHPKDMTPEQRKRLGYK